MPPKPVNDNSDIDHIRAGLPDRLLRASKKKPQAPGPLNIRKQKKVATIVKRFSKMRVIDEKDEEYVPEGNDHIEDE